MKQFMRLVALVLVLATVMAVPVWASAAEERASQFFMSSNVYLHKETSTTFLACFSVTAMGEMDELGAKSIKIQRSADGSDWLTVRTFSKDYDTHLICSNTSSHATYVSYNGSTGYYYRALITLYAKNDEGTGEWHRYTSSILL